MIPPLDLLSEFARIAESLRGKRVRYALIGGLALAAHGVARATKDVDFLVHAEDLARFRSAVATVGYRIHSEVVTFRESGMTLHRLVKPLPDPEDALIIDALVPSDPRHVEMIRRAQRMRWGTGFVKVVRRADLIDLKRGASRPQDLADIENLDAKAKKLQRTGKGHT